MAAKRGPRAESPVFETSREFDAPLALVWSAWSEADRLQQWWGPKGCRIDVLTLQFRPGGFFHYAMNYENAPTMWGRFLYREIAAPRRIVWLNSFSNERCGIARAPFSADCPLEIENSAQFIERGGKTRVDLRATPHGAEPNELQFFVDLFASLEQGYGGTFDQLAEHLRGRA